MIRLQLIRHGKTDINELGCLCGWYDAELSEKGINELKLLQGSHKKTELYFSSDLKRSYETFAILFPDEKLERTISQLREINFLKMDLFPEYELDMKNIFKDWVLGKYHEFEPYRDFIVRIKTGIDIVVNECKRKQVNDATIITHAGVIMAIKNEVSSAPASAFTSLKVDNGKSIILYIDDNQHWMIKE